VRLAATAMSASVVGEYQLQAAIAALHDGAERTEDTDWPQILGLYGLLARPSGRPMVELNRAVAAAARTTSEPERQYLVTKAAKLNQRSR
jgi:predicted RNA polymerase sigma factor